MFTYEELEDIRKRCDALVDDGNLSVSMRIHILDLQNAVRRMQIDYDFNKYVYPPEDTGAQSE